MPDPVTAASIAADANTVASASVDGQSASAVPIPDKKLALEIQKAETALAGTNASGGVVSGWSKMRMAKYRNCGGPQ